jgi:hypothetical protein
MNRRVDRSCARNGEIQEKQLPENFSTLPIEIGGAVFICQRSFV